MQRRQFLEKTGLGSAALISVATPAALHARESRISNVQEEHDHRQISGPLASATVSFGQWQTDPPLDRFPNLTPIPRNQHQLTPFVAFIRAGGTVNFIVSGFHHILVYDDGVKPEDINDDATILPTNGGPPLINDPANRIYRGFDPSLVPQDRTEVLHFPRRGTFLMMCGVRLHFVNDRMFGYIRVLP